MKSTSDFPILTRQLIRSGGIERLLAEEAPGLRPSAQSDLEASMQTMLEARPDDDVWLFGYGSLIWNPAIRIAERKVARIDGWQRSFSLACIAGRGSTDNPGLVLALEEGGTCDGVALRIDDNDLVEELRLVWRREMILGAYMPRWVDLLDRDGRRFGSAIAFTINPASDVYVGTLDTATIVERLATAVGSLGSSADYLYRTCEALREHGIPDRCLETLAESVRNRQSQEA